jgi:hypothetical protein
MRFEDVRERKGKGFARNGRAMRNGKTSDLPGQQNSAITHCFFFEARARSNLVRFNKSISIKFGRELGSWIGSMLLCSVFEHNNVSGCVGMAGFLMLGRIVGSCLPASKR